MPISTDKLPAYAQVQDLEEVDDVFEDIEYLGRHISLLTRRQKVLFLTAAALVVTEVAITTVYILGLTIGCSSLPPSKKLPSYCHRRNDQLTEHQREWCDKNRPGIGKDDCFVLIGSGGTVLLVASFVVSLAIYGCCSHLLNENRTAIDERAVEEP